VARKPPGASCEQPYECLSGACPADDGVCCDAPCDGECEACVGMKTGGANGSCEPVTAGEDPDGECVAGPPCGPSGAGCNGDALAPACLGVCSSCEELFTGNVALLEICASAGATCTIRANTVGVGCENVCNDSGRACVDAWHDNPEGTCTQGQAASCFLGMQPSILCVCSRGCGAGPACVAPLVCVAGLCQ
jgi:hypothetical protein